MSSDLIVCFVDVLLGLTKFLALVLSSFVLACALVAFCFTLSHKKGGEAVEIKSFMPVSYKQTGNLPRKKQYHSEPCAEQPPTGNVAQTFWDWFIKAFKGGNQCRK